MGAQAGQLALGVVGGIIGYVVSGFNPLGASIGFALGPAVGPVTFVADSKAPA